MRMRSTCKLVGGWVICVALGAVACDDSEDHVADAALAACEAGDVLACECADGSHGLSLCDATERAGACECEPVRTTPCSAPGRAFACRCDAASIGEQVCLTDGRYTSCACSDERAVDGEDAGTEPSTPSEPSKPSTTPKGCPSGFSCVEQMGYRVCADDTTVPPLCAAKGDCAAAGLPDAACLDPGVGGVMLCVQACEL